MNGQTYKRMNLQLSATSGYKFQSAAGEEFVANELVDAWSQNPAVNSGATFNWAFALIPESRLTTFFSVAWAPGSTDGNQNGSPVWVMSPNPTIIYVKYDGNLGTGAGISPCGFHYDVAYNLSSLSYKKIFDNADKDQSGLAVFTCDGNKIFGVYGEDAATAGTAYPYLDAGTSIQPLCAERRVFANDDFATTAINQPVSIPVTTNDAGWLTTLDYNSVSTAGQLQPHHGTVTVYPGGTISYQPDSGFVGSDTFQYNICSIDVSLLCDNALVIVNVTGCGSGLNQIILSGQVFKDVNENGIADDGGFGLSNVKIRLYQDYNCNNVVDATDLIIDSVLTNNSGSYQFTHNPEHTIMDNFDGTGGSTTCRTGSDGTDPWNGDWTYMGLFNANCTPSSFSNDDVITTTDLGDYALRIKDNSKTATRSLNLLGATQAYISFDFRRGTNFTSGSNVKFQVSSNGGGSWNTLYTIAGNSLVDATYIPVQNLNITSSSDVSSVNVNLYPNPTLGAININLIANMQTNVKVEIYDMTGRMVVDDFVIANVGSNLISETIEQMPAGAYLLKVSTSDQVVLKNIIKQ